MAKKNSRDAESQGALLEQEWHVVTPKGKKYVVANYEKALVQLA